MYFSNIILSFVNFTLFTKQPNQNAKDINEKYNLRKSAVKWLKHCSAEIIVMSLHIIRDNNSLREQKNIPAANAATSSYMPKRWKPFSQKPAKIERPHLSWWPFLGRVHGAQTY